MIICYTTKNGNKTETTEADILHKLSAAGYNIKGGPSYEVYQGVTRISRFCGLKGDTFIYIHGEKNTIIFIILKGEKATFYLKMPDASLPDIINKILSDASTLYTELPDPLTELSLRTGKQPSSVQTALHRT